MLSALLIVALVVVSLITIGLFGAVFFMFAPWFFWDGH